MGVPPQIGQAGRPSSVEGTVTVLLHTSSGAAILAITAMSFRCAAVKACLAVCAIGRRCASATGPKRGGIS